ncbi:TIGR04222 domain-containing membrane protein [Streptosporangium sp. NPDC023963]|uniref:TIGR04222 domain-containing membrane protein n=1 Tax=Streptosporangium sp. NPDC023963 TaxID=3155608 RepID=UPI0034178BCC
MVIAIIAVCVIHAMVWIHVFVELARFRSILREERKMSPLPSSPTPCEAAYLAGDRQRAADLALAMTAVSGRIRVSREGHVTAVTGATGDNPVEQGVLSLLDGGPVSVWTLRVRTAQLQAVSGIRWHLPSRGVRGAAEIKYESERMNARIDVTRMIFGFFGVLSLFAFPLLLLGLFKWTWSAPAPMIVPVGLCLLLCVITFALFERIPLLDDRAEWIEPFLRERLERHLPHPPSLAFEVALNGFDALDDRDLAARLQAWKPPGARPRSTYSPGPGLTSGRAEVATWYPTHYVSDLGGSDSGGSTSSCGSSCT